MEGWTSVKAKRNNFLSSRKFGSSQSTFQQNTHTKYPNKTKIEFERNTQNQYGIETKILHIITTKKAHTESQIKIKLPHTYYLHIMKFLYRTPTQITTNNRTPTQITHTEFQANPEQVQFVCIYLSLVNTSVVIWNVNLKYKHLVFLPKFDR